MVNIFISYSRTDSAVVDRLEADLHQQGFSPWVDRHDLEAGSKWRRELQDAVERAKVLLLVLSPEAVASEYVQKEYGYAIDEGKVVIPLYYRACKVPWDLRGIQGIDFQHSYDTGLAALLAALRVDRETASLGSSPTGSEPQAERPWNVPFSRNPFFTGRSQLLEQLHDHLGRAHSAALSQSQALTGLGGIGKTQTAIEYAYRYRDEYKAVFWVRAASRETLVADFVALARLLKLPGPDAQDQMQVVATVKRWLEQHQDWLLILDNADELSLVKDFLPTRSEGHVLLTTRAQATGKIAQSLSIERLEPSESMQLLLRRAKLLAPDEPLDNVSRAVRTSAQTLVEELDGLPLALDQVGAYIEETGCSLEEYLTLYRRHRLALLKRQSSISADYPHSVASTWSLSFGQVEQESPAAAELLRLCAYLAPDAIPEEIIAEGAVEFGLVLSSVVVDPLLLNETIQVLRRYSLVKRDPEARLLNLHRLVQVVLKDAMNQEMQRQWAERSVRAVSRVFPEVSFDTWSRCERCLPHAQFCAVLIDEHRFIFPEAARLLDQAGYYLRERGLYGQAEPLLHQALAMREQVLGTEHIDTATSLHAIGVLYSRQGKYEQAEQLLRSALSIREKALGATHPNTATTVHELAWLYQDQGRYEKAEPLYQRALAIREQALGPQHPATASTLHELARLYQDQGQLEQARPLYQRALAINEQVLGSQHPGTVGTVHELARLYQNLGQYARAEPLYQRALAVYEQALGATHPDTADTVVQLALLYQNQGQFSNAEPLYQRALAVYEQALGPEHPRSAYTLNTLATLYHDQGQYAVAELFYQRALTIREKVLGPELPDTAATLYSLARLYEAQGRYDQAEPLLQRTLNICEKFLGPEHPNTAATLRELAGIYQAQGRYEQAEPLLQRALNICEKFLGLEHPNTAATLYVFAIFYQLQGQYTQAEPLFQRALSIREQVLGPNHPLVATSLNGLAQLYCIEGKYEQAKPLFQRALAIREQKLEHDHPDIVASREAYANLLQMMKEQQTITPQHEAISQGK